MNNEGMGIDNTMNARDIIMKLEHENSVPVVTPKINEMQSGCSRN